MTTSTAIAAKTLQFKSAPIPAPPRQVVTSGSLNIPFEQGRLLLTGRLHRAPLRTRLAPLPPKPRS